MNMSNSPKIRNLIPRQLMLAVLHTIRGNLTKEDQAFLQESCGTKVLDRDFFCDDQGVLFLEVSTEDADGQTAVDEFGADEIHGGENYLEAAYYTLICEAMVKLPAWVGCHNDFLFDWNAYGDISAEEAVSAVDEAWTYIFDNANSIAGSRLSLTTLAYAVIRQMKTDLPGWLIQSLDNVSPEPSIPVSSEVLSELQLMYQDHEESLQTQDEHYVSPFSGESR